MRNLTALIVGIVTTAVGFILAASPTQPGVSAPPMPGGVSVKSFGAVGNGKHDDTAAIQLAIDSLKVGGVVHFPIGRYEITKPLHLPRTGLLPLTAVRLIGEDQLGSIIEGMSSFPAHHGLVEWATPASDSSANQMRGQRVSDLTFWLPWGVDGVSAIKHIPFNKLDTAAACQNEWMQIDVENVRIECSNAFNEVVFDFPDGFRQSNWRNITADPWRGEPSAPIKYDTILLRVGSGYPGGPSYPGEDSIGVCFSHLDMLTPMQNRGGYCRTFEGRMYSSTMENCVDNGGRYGTGAIAFHYINSSQLVLRNLACEGGGSCTLKLDNCDQIDATQITGGTPPMGMGPYQDSIIINNSRRVRINGHIAVPGAMPFSALGVHALAVDKDSRDCVFDSFDIRVTFDAAMPTPATRELSIDPAAGVKVNGSAVQSYGNIRQSFTIGTPEKSQ